MKKRVAAVSVRILLSFEDNVLVSAHADQGWSIPSDKEIVGGALVIEGNKVVLDVENPSEIFRED